MTLNGNGQSHPAKNCQKPAQIFQESVKSHCNISPSNQTKISLSNNNLPMSNRNKHPTHIPYDPHLHRNSKPPYSFSCLIFMAIEDSPVKALPVKEVYAWILEHFPYFRNAPTGWKNSVRHNLSLNKCFRKVEKAPVSVRDISLRGNTMRFIGIVTNRRIILNVYITFYFFFFS